MSDRSTPRVALLTAGGSGSGSGSGGSGGGITRSM